MAGKLDDKEDESTIKADFKTSVDVDNDILKCPICFEVFNKPKYLPCLHTFCEACLDSYIVSSVQQDLETKNNETESEPKPKVDFKCPVCRVVVPVSDQTLPVEEWASTFTTNHSLLALLDKQKLQRNVKLCDPCQMDSKDVTAKSWCKVCNEALCETCANYHRKFVATKQHKLFPITEEGGDDYEITRFEYCETHKDRQLEAFCFDHDQPCCVSCVTINHRKCDHVSTLADAAKDVLEKPEITELKQALNEMEKLLSSMLEVIKCNISNVRQEKQNMLACISELRIRINTHLDGIQSKLEEEIKSSEKQHVSELNEIVFDLENRQKRVGHYCNLIGTVSAKATDIHVFLEMKKLKRKQEEIEVYLKSALKDIKLVDCSLMISTTLEKDVFVTSNFGTVGVQRTDISGSFANICKDFNIMNKLQRYTSCMFSSFSNFSVSSHDVKDAIFLPDGTVSLASGHKIYYINIDGANKKVIDFPESASLYGIEVLNASEMVVARNSSDSIHVVNFQRKLDAGKLTKFKGVMWITILDNKIVVSSERKIGIMETNGTLKREIDVPDRIESIASFNQNILYTNRKTDMLYCITLEGNKVFEYQHPELKKPIGVTTDEDGYIFVVGQESSNVHQVSPKGEHVNIVLTEGNGIKNPSIICYDKNNKRLLVIHSAKKANVYQRAW